MVYRLRNIEKKLKLFVLNFKVVLLSGARQTGKSTLLSHLFPDMPMITFDPVQDLYNARRDPDMFLDHFQPPLILDEIQYAPELLPALKRRVDRSEAAGQYILTGSQQFSILKDVSESLAGRVGILHLDPMIPSECQGRLQEPSWLEQWLDAPGQAADLFTPHPPLHDRLFRMLWRGLLPGTLDLPDALISDYLRSYTGTYIDRDIRKIAQVRETQEFMRFVNLCGALTAREVNRAQLGRDIGVVPGTAAQWQAMLAACYQWREIPAYSGNVVKKVSGKSKGYLTDTGMACWLQRISSPETLAASPALGQVFETFVMHVIHATAQAMASPPMMWHWRTAGGAEVDILLERDGNLYPIEAKCSTVLHGHDTRAMQALKKTYGGRVQPGLIVYAGNVCYPLNEHAVAVPWTAF